MVCEGNVTFTDEDFARLDEVAPPGRVTVPYYGYDGMAWRGRHGDRINIAGDIDRQ